MAIKNAYLKELLARVEKRNQGEPEFGRTRKADHVQGALGGR